jgi:pimeloyl-ACP methyl ester carboxylesterase
LIEKSFLSLTSRGFHHVAYNEWGKKDRAQTVICVHGLTRNSHDFDTAAERYFRKIYQSFGPLTDAQWADLTRHSVRRRLEDRAYSLTYDPDIVAPMRNPQDLNLWPVREEIRCPVLLLRGSESDVLSKDIVERMLKRGPKTELVEFPGVGHAPALRDAKQIEVIKRWLLAS